MATKTLFEAGDSLHGGELWITDGTAAGTSLVMDIYPGAAGSNPSGFAQAGGEMLFAADDGIHGTELWATDGTGAGTTLLSDIQAGPGPSNPSGLTPFGSDVVFSADDGAHGAELWISDGTAAGTSMLMDISPGAGGSYVGNFAQLNSEMLFQATDAVGAGLWETDGTSAGTVKISALYPTGSYSAGSRFTVADGQAFWWATAGPLGIGLWVTDGTTAGTSMALAMIPGQTLSYLAALGSSVVFAADAGATGSGTELWVSDGSIAGTAMLKDINPGSAGSNPTDITTVGDHVLFFADDGDGVNTLWTTDGTAAGTNAVAAVPDGAGIVAVGNEAFFNGNDGVHGDELWVSDGTAAGTGQVKDLDPGTAGSNPYYLTAVGDHVLFSARDANAIYGLWSSDGTDAGTFEISADAINPQNFQVFTAPSCFAEGTRILTTRGEVPVQRLVAGDLVPLAGGPPAPIRWIGRSRVDPARHPVPWNVHPVHIRAGAFSGGLPRRDLLLSPEHAVFVDGALIPVRHLVNDATVTQEAGGAITYWHVELEAHGVIFAEGMPAETYLDTGNRASFDGAAVRALHPDFAPGDPAAYDARACAPLVESGPTLARVRARLAARARRGRVAAPATLNVRLAATGTVRTTLPAGVARVHLVSPWRVPDGDRRRLGAAISGLELDGAALPLGSGCVAAGFHEVETGSGSWRWTDGRGVLRLPPSDQPRSLTIEIVAFAAAA